MALLKSKAAKLAAQADATRLLEAAPASAQGPSGIRIHMKTDKTQVLAQSVAANN
jgi:hypothetical protein